MSRKGTDSATMVRRDINHVWGQGWNITEEWRGGRASIDGAVQSFINEGWTTQIINEGEYSTLVATRQSSYGNQATEYYDRFTITKEAIERDIWTLPAVQAEMSLYGSDDAGKNEYKENILDASDGDWAPGDADAFMASQFGAEASPTYPVAWQIYIELCRGAESYEDEYIILQRTRLVSSQYAADRLSIPELNASIIYTTSQMQSVFSIPTFAGISWPVDPVSVPANTKWGWRNRRREIMPQEGARIEVSQDWAYAAWSTNIYSVYAT